MIQAVVERCAGIDVGKTFVVVCVMTGAANEEPHVERRRFGTFNEDLERLRLWLKDERCTARGNGKYGLLLEAHLQHPRREH